MPWHRWRALRPRLSTTRMRDAACPVSGNGERSHHVRRSATAPNRKPTSRVARSGSAWRQRPQTPGTTPASLQQNDRHIAFESRHLSRRSPNRSAAAAPSAAPLRAAIPRRACRCVKASAMPAIISRMAGAYWFCRASNARRPVPPAGSKDRKFGFHAGSPSQGKLGGQLQRGWLTDSARSGSGCL